MWILDVLMYVTGGTFLVCAVYLLVGIIGQKSDKDSFRVRTWIEIHRDAMKDWEEQFRKQTRIPEVEQPEYVNFFQKHKKPDAYELTKERMIWLKDRKCFFLERYNKLPYASVREWEDKETARVIVQSLDNLDKAILWYAELSKQYVYLGGPDVLDVCLHPSANHKNAYNLSRLEERIRKSIV